MRSEGRVELLDDRDGVVLMAEAYSPRIPSAYSRRMPELPEGRASRTTLSRALAARRNARRRDAGRETPRIGRGTSARQFSRALVGRRVLGVERRGKWLRVLLDEGTLLSHLGMTGKWVRGTSDARLRFERAARSDPARAQAQRALSGPAHVRIAASCARRSARVARARARPLARRHRGRCFRRAAVASQRRHQAGLARSEAHRRRRQHSSNRSTLSRAPRSATTTARSLTRKEVAALVRGIERSITRTLALEKGPSITYVEEPGAPNPFLIYDRGGEPCPKCRRPLTKIVQAGRSTVYCAHDQR